MTRAVLDAVGATDAGNVRHYNEDTIAIAPEIGLLAVADGMGGHRAGDVASRMAIHVVSAALRAHVAGSYTAASLHSPLLAVRLCIQQANKAIFDAAQTQSTHEGMGTTIAVAFFHGDGVVIGHVGDSRIYRLRAGRLALLTRDDSLLRDEVELGYIAAADAAHSHNRSLVTQALGLAPNVTVHVRGTDALHDDVFLLCSDGVNDLVEDADIELVLNSLHRNLPLAAQHLLQAGKDNGGYDNLSVVIGKMRAPSSAPGWRGLWARLTGR